mmetsp:Transcript_58398/g.143244  ORF Transcript_58398/g.143244 Transcript_58398/m.143244 type:complete len:100 (+) Transcript_58398:116-415(+)
MTRSSSSSSSCATWWCPSMRSTWGVMNLGLYPPPLAQHLSVVDDKVVVLVVVVRHVVVPPDQVRVGGDEEGGILHMVRHKQVLLLRLLHSPTVVILDDV